MQTESICLVGGSGFIGYHLHQFLLDAGVEHVIFDKRPPGKHFDQVESHVGNLENIDDVKNFFSSRTFTAIINLAARTDDSSDLLEDYLVNFQGVEHLIKVLEYLDFKGQFVQISSQYVERPKTIYEMNSISPPVNVYGESKLIAEERLKDSSLTSWVILRPTNVWGTYHPGFPSGFWKVIKSGLYLHPKKKVIRSYVFVGSLCSQIYQFTKLDPSSIHGKTFYVSDEPIDSFVWVNLFSLGIRGQSARVAPVLLLKIAAIIGDLLVKMNIRFPLTSKRFKSMTTDYSIDLKNTWEVIKKPDFDIEMEVLRTSHWYLENFTN